MRIGFDYRLGGSINAGIGRYSFELLKTMLEQNRGDEFVVIYNQNNVLAEDLAVFEALGAKLVPTKIRHYSLAEQLWLPKILKSLKLDLMHFPNFNVPVYCPVPYVVTIHDVVHHKISGHKRGRVWKFRAYKYVIENAAKKARLILTVTEFAKKEIVQYLNVSADKVQVIYEAMGSRPEKITPAQSLKKKFLLSRPYILFVGTLERKKNLPFLAKAFDLFLSKYNYDMDLVITGKTDLHYPEIRQQMLQVGRANRMVFTGFVSDADQAGLYEGAYAFITPSLHEGFGLPALEAMRYGVPVLAANTEVFNEVYDNAAIYFDPTDLNDLADNLNLLVSDQPFYTRMSLLGKERSAMFDWQETAQQTLSAYHSVFHKNFEPESE